MDLSEAAVSDVVPIAHGEDSEEENALLPDEREALEMETSTAGGLRTLRARRKVAKTKARVRKTLVVNSRKRKAQGLQRPPDAAHVPPDVAHDPPVSDVSVPFYCGSQTCGKVSVDPGDGGRVLHPTVHTQGWDHGYACHLRTTYVWSWIPGVQFIAHLPTQQAS